MNVHASQYTRSLSLACVVGVGSKIDDTDLSQDCERRPNDVARNEDPTQQGAQAPSAAYHRYEEEHQGDGQQQRVAQYILMNDTTNDER